MRLERHNILLAFYLGSQYQRMGTYYWIIKKNHELFRKAVLPFPKEAVMSQIWACRQTSLYLAELQSPQAVWEQLLQLLHLPLGIYRHVHRGCCSGTAAQGLLVSKREGFCPVKPPFLNCPLDGPFFPHFPDSLQGLGILCPGLSLPCNSPASDGQPTTNPYMK